MSKMMGMSALLLCQAALAAEFKIEEQVVAPAWAPGSTLTLSSKGMRVGSCHQKDGKWVVTIDGMESGPYDEVLNSVATFRITELQTGQISHDLVEQGPVAFSADGVHYAYAARIGSNVSVIKDGKTIFNAPHSQAAPPVSFLRFTPDSQHLIFYNATPDTLQSFRLIMDAVPATPPLDQKPQPVFSKDGTRWLVNGGRAKNPGERIVVVDGKEVGVGAKAQFSIQGKKVGWISTTGTVETLVVDGKSIVSGPSIDRFRISDSLGAFAIVKRSGVKRELYQDGKALIALEGAVELLLSPNGEHWAAKGMTGIGQAYWVAVDGKKQKEYKDINGISFSPDSSVCVYYGFDGANWHLVANGQESEPYAVVRGFAFAPAGYKYAYAAGSNERSMKLYFDGKASQPHNVIYNFSFSPDGARYAYFANTGPNMSDFMLDGEVKGIGNAFGGTAIFSPDSKHVAAEAWPSNSHSTVYIDGAFLPERVEKGLPREFTPDNKHLISSVLATDENRNPVFDYYLDGDKVARFSAASIKWINSPKMVKEGTGPKPFGVDYKMKDPNAKEWEALPDGAIVFVGSAASKTGAGPITRVKVSPHTTTTFATWIAELPATMAKMEKEAAEKKAKELQDKAAIKEKADAEAAAVAAKRKADYDAAVAAKNKARLDAANVKKLQILNAQRARKGQPPLENLPD